MKHRLQILGAALLFSTGGAAIKATTLTSWQVAGFRSGVAALAVLLLVRALRVRGMHDRSGSRVMRWHPMTRHGGRPDAR